MKTKIFYLIGWLIGIVIVLYVKLFNKKQEDIDAIMTWCFTKVLGNKGLY